VISRLARIVVAASCGVVGAFTLGCSSAPDESVGDTNGAVTTLRCKYGQRLDYVYDPDVPGGKYPVCVDITVTCTQPFTIEKCNSTICYCQSMVTSTPCAAPNGDQAGDAVSAADLPGCTVGQIIAPATPRWPEDYGYALWLCPVGKLSAADTPYPVPNYCGSRVGSPLDPSWVFVEQDFTGAPVNCGGSCQ
jgi:hypothetical protein